MVLVAKNTGNLHALLDDLSKTSLALELQEPTATGYQYRDVVRRVRRAAAVRACEAVAFRGSARAARVHGRRLARDAAFETGGHVQCASQWHSVEYSH